jgi:enoyl-CoA hydratase/carnithine racemase
MTTDRDAQGQVTLDWQETIALIRLDRPEKCNALTPRMLADLEQHLSRLDYDHDVRAVVIASAGDRSFCAGADIKLFTSLPALDMWSAWTRMGQRVFNRLSQLRQPTIAAVAGDAFGGGFELALACDLRVIAEDSTLGFPEVGIATLPGWGGTGRLRELVGPTRCKELILTGQPLSASVALAWGVANRLAPKAEVLATASDLARKIAKQAPIAVQMAKQAIDCPGASEVIEQVAAAATATTADAAEGRASFAERRPPTYSGV